jgi:site-specific recombinase XerD
MLPAASVSEAKLYMEENMFYVDLFLDHLTERGYRYATLRAYRRLLDRFTEYCGELGVSDVTAVGHEQALAFIRSLGEPDRLTKATLQKISRLRAYFRFLEEKGLIFESPLRGYTPPEIAETHYPVLTEGEITEILIRIEGKDGLYYKARAILELAYSSALRPRELYSLKLSDIDYRKGILFLEQSKGRKDRMVPVGKRALCLLHHYIDTVRPRYLKGKTHDYVFVNHHTGEPLTVYGIRWAIQESLRRSGLAPIKTYSLRVSAATHLLHAGMGVLPISKLLGHQSVRTTLYYLRIPLRELINELALKHPRRRMEGSIRDKEQGGHE